MDIATITWSRERKPAWSVPLTELEAFDSDHTLVLAFADRSLEPDPLVELTSALPSAVITGCSTSGQIVGGEVADEPLAVALVKFRGRRPTVVSVDFEPDEAAAGIGRRLGRAVTSSVDFTPTCVVLLSEGVSVNASDLVAGLAEELPTSCRISGGLAGDGDRFEQTWVWVDGRANTHAVVALAFADNVSVRFGSQGGWQGFGPYRKITRSRSSTLYELDGKPALTLYREYLGDLAAELPGSALMYPLCIESPDRRTSYVRTILGIDETDESMRFAGDVPEGWSARLMRTTTDRLVEGAHQAALASAQREVSLTLAISCVGRRLAMGSRSEEETEAVLDALGADSSVIGFYSYGEISPIDGVSGLHNQTMTVTTFAEQGSGA